MIDVKETLQKSEERMEMAAMFLEDELNRIRAGQWIPMVRKFL